MGDLALKEVAVWAVVGLVGWFFTLRLLERGVWLINGTVEGLWSAIEVALGGAARRPSSSSRGVRRRARRKVRASLSFALWTIADPFAVILRSIWPEADPEPDAVQDAPQAETAAPEDEPVKTGPTEPEYRAAVAKFGLSPACQRTAAAKKWAALRSTGGPDREREIDAAWLVICEYRGFKPD